MSKIWQLQEAKNRLSQVVDEALNDGPQIITRRGKEVAVVLSINEYEEIKKPATCIVDFFQNSPFFETQLDLERNKSLSREIDF